MIKYLIIGLILLSIIPISSAQIYSLDNEKFLEAYYSFEPGTPEDYFFQNIGLIGRAFATETNIYINKDAYWFDDREKQLTLEHEFKHLEGYNHTIFGIMSPLSIIRYFTS